MVWTNAGPTLWSPSTLLVAELSDTLPAPVDVYQTSTLRVATPAAMVLTARAVTPLRRLPTTMGPRPTTMEPVVLVNSTDRVARSTTGATPPRWWLPMIGTM